MRRFITTTAFTLAIIILYQLIDINLFTIDLPQRVRCELFKDLRYDPEIDPKVVIFDIGYISLDTVKIKLKDLKSLSPKVIGVNLCNIREKSRVLDEFLAQNKNIITCDCGKNSPQGTSRMTTSAGEVTHFKVDKDSYFELKVSSRYNRIRERGNDTERIMFRGEDMYYQASLSDIENIPHDLIKGKTIIVGFLRDSLVTPMNSWYGRSGYIKGDMSDSQISANIISTINRSEFINEVNVFLRVLIVLIVSLLYALIIRLARSQRSIVNIVLAVLFFILLNGLSTLIIVSLFAKGYYLNIDEMTIVLLITGIVGVYWNAKKKSYR